jgi:hypothetical protein
MWSVTGLKLPVIVVSWRVPNQPKTPLRTIRVPDELWRKALKLAAKNGETVSEVIRRALIEYVTTGSRSSPASPKRPRQRDAQ